MMISCFFLIKIDEVLIQSNTSSFLYGLFYI